jgi:TIR domain
MADLFISHIHEEADVAEAVMRFLREFDLAAFLSSDHWQLHAGERWFERIATELNDSKVVILLLSQRSVARPWINFEAGWAWATRKIIPVCYGGLKKDGMPRPYSDLQGLNLRSDYYDLVKDCYFYLKNLGRLAPLPLMGDEPHVKALLAALDQSEALLTQREPASK